MLQSIFYDEPNAAELQPKTADMQAKLLLDIQKKTGAALGKRG